MDLPVYLSLTLPQSASLELASLSRIRFLILDEADRMVEQVMSSVSAIRLLGVEVSKGHFKEVDQILSLLPPFEGPGAQKKAEREKAGKSKRKNKGQGQNERETVFFFECVSILNLSAGVEEQRQTRSRRQGREEPAVRGRALGGCLTYDTLIFAVSICGSEMRHLIFAASNALRKPRQTFVLSATLTVSLSNKQQTSIGVYNTVAMYEKCNSFLTCATEKLLEKVDFQRKRAVIDLSNTTVTAHKLTEAKLICLNEEKVCSARCDHRSLIV